MCVLLIKQTQKKRSQVQQALGQTRVKHPGQSARGPETLAKQKEGKRWKAGNR